MNREYSLEKLDKDQKAFILLEITREIIIKSGGELFELENVLEKESADREKEMED